MVQLTVSFLKEDGFVVKSTRMLVDPYEPVLDLLQRSVRKCWGKSWEWLPIQTNRPLGFVTKRGKSTTPALYPEITGGWK